MLIKSFEVTKSTALNWKRWNQQTKNWFLYRTNNEQ